MRRDAERIFDEYLAASARAGDRDAFNRLATRWHPKLIAHAYRLTQEAEQARDVTQEAWRDIANGISGLKDAATFPAWAYRIVTRRAADMIRKAQRDRKLSAAYAAEEQMPRMDENTIEAKADSAVILRAMAALPGEQRAAIALYYKEGFSVAEIAAALKVPAGTVKTRLMHGRRKIRAALDQGGSNE